MRVAINRKEKEEVSGLVFKKRWNTYFVGVKAELSSQEREILGRCSPDQIVAELAPLFPKGPDTAVSYPQIYRLTDVLGSGRGYTFLTPVEANAAEVKLTEGLKELKQIIAASELPPDGRSSFDL